MRVPIALGTLGWKLAVRKHRNVAVWMAVARKLAVSIWHLLMGHCIEMQEPVQHLATKLLKIATLLGKESLKQAGFARRADFVRHLLESINISQTPQTPHFPLD